MKTSMWLFALLSIAFCNSSLSQVIPNGGFENWYPEEYFEEPDTFLTSNFRIWFTAGTTNVSKTTDSHSGTFAAKLETVAANDEIIAGFIIIGNASEGGITGGVPFTERPDSLTGYIKYSNDTTEAAMVLCWFKKEGEFIGTAGSNFVGIEENYVRFAIGIEWSSPDLPDSMVFLASSSDMGGAAQPGAIFYVDGLGFTGTTVPFPNGDLEDWHMVSTEEPEDWNTFNAFGFFFGSLSAFKSTDSYAGIYALELHNIQMPGDQIMGIVTNGYLGDFGPTGGMHVDGNPMLLSGYYKYFPDGPDTAMAGGWSYYYDPIGDSTVLLEQMMTKLPSTEDYTYFEVPFQYNGWPPVDTLNITFAAGNITSDSSYVGLNSVLYIDSLNLEYYPVSTGPDLNKETKCIIYPNPAQDYIRIESSSAIKFMEIINAQGKTVFSARPFKKQYFVDIHHLQDGIYIVEIETGDSDIFEKIMILK
jgi:hypothetical protein